MQRPVLQVVFVIGMGMIAMVWLRRLNAVVLLSAELDAELVTRHPQLGHHQREICRRCLAWIQKVSSS